MARDAFTAFHDRAAAFYGELAANNARDWFEPRKAAWKADVEAPAKLFAELMAEEVSRLTGAGHAPKLFRIHRDVRFSKDKSPYKTALAMTWGTGDPDPLVPVFYMAIEPARTLVACGAPGFDKEALARWRALVDARGDDLAEAIAATGADLLDIGPEPLKRVPKPYAPDHPHGDLLRRKGLAVGRPLPDGWRARGGLLDATVEAVEALLPFRTFMAARG